MWYSVIAMKYGLSSNGWDSKPARRVSITCPWKNISRILPSFITHARFDVGKGNKIKSNFGRIYGRGMKCWHQNSKEYSPFPLKRVYQSPDSIPHQPQLLL